MKRVYGMENFIPVQIQCPQQPVEPSGNSVSHPPDNGYKANPVNQQCNKHHIIFTNMFSSTSPYSLIIWVQERTRTKFQTEVHDPYPKNITENRLRCASGLVQQQPFRYIYTVYPPHILEQ